MKLVRILIAACFVGSPVFAQDTAAWQTSTDPEVRATLAKYAQCVAKRDPNGTVGFLVSGRVGAANNPQFRALANANQHCLPDEGDVTLQPVYFAGDAAEFFYKESKFRLLDHLDAVPPTTKAWGACVVVRQPKQAAALLATQPGSQDEANAAMALAPSIEECMPLVFKSAEMVRATVASDVFPYVTQYLRTTR